MKNEDLRWRPNNRDVKWATKWVCFHKDTEEIFGEVVKIFEVKFTAWVGYSKIGDYASDEGARAAVAKRLTELK